MVQVKIEMRRCLKRIRRERVVNSRTRNKREGGEDEERMTQKKRVEILGLNSCRSVAAASSPELSRGYNYPPNPQISIFSSGCFQGRGPNGLFRI